MKKYILMALLSSFIGIMSNPEVLTASDRVALVGVSNAGVVETVPAEESVLEMANENVAVSNSGNYVYSNMPVDTSVQVATSVSYAPANNIQIAGRTIEVVPGGVGDSGGHVNMNGRLLAGHNSAEVFGGLSSLGVGETFSVTINGVATNYRVSGMVTYAKEDLNKQVSYVCGYGTKICNGNLMSQLKDPTDAEMKHSLVLMTCAGTMLGGGDATHRLVVFADII